MSVSLLLLRIRLRKQVPSKTKESSQGKQHNKLTEMNSKKPKLKRLVKLLEQDIPIRPLTHNFNVLIYIIAKKTAKFLKDNHNNITDYSVKNNTRS